MTEENDTFIHYLEAKKPLDDRSLNANVWQTFIENLPPATPQSPLRILELGAGIGTMIERLIERGVLSYAVYTALDSQVPYLQAGRRRLSAWAAARSLSVTDQGQELCLAADHLGIRVNYFGLDLFEWLKSDHRDQPYDLILAHAFLDLVNVEDILPFLCERLKAGGLFYFTLIFDGLTIFEPVVDKELDDLIIHLYHQSMDNRQKENSLLGDSRSGRKVFTAVSQAGGELLDAGASDWVVFPRRGIYQAGEAEFLFAILGMVEGALLGHLELDECQFRQWLAIRRAQIAEGKLIYIAHQLDVVGIKGNSTNGG